MPNMSYTHLDEVVEQSVAIERAILEDDDTTLFYYADLEAKKDNMEYAEALRGLARKARQNNWAYDESINN